MIRWPDHELSVASCLKEGTTAAPENLQPLAKEAWTRAACGKLSDELIYPSDAQWAGIYDRLKNPTEGEASRRREIHMRYPVSTAL